VGAGRLPRGHHLLAELLQLSRCTPQLRSGLVRPAEHRVNLGTRQLHAFSVLR
jgi:hypothetical protein